MLRRHFLVLPVLTLIFTALPAPDAQARPRVHPIYNPDPIVVKGKSAASVKKGIKKALFARRWQAKDVKGGLIRATYTKSGRRGITHKAVVDVSYSASKVTIKYHSSEELNYDKESGTIHGTYNRWIQNMERDIRAELGAY